MASILVTGSCAVKPMSKFIPQLPLLMVRMEGLPHLWALGTQPVQQEGLVGMDSNDCCGSNVV